jgi:hypothetical protein
MKIIRTREENRNKGEKYMNEIVPSFYVIFFAGN